MIELSPSRNANILAVAAILGVIGTFTLVWKAVEGVATTAGPSALATGDGGEVYFVAGAMLYRTDHNGVLQDSVALEALRMGRTVSQLAVSGEALLVAEGGGRLHRCDPVHHSCTLLATIPMLHRGGPLAVAAAPEVRRLYLADADNHRLYAYGSDGKRLYELDIDGGLKYPNEVIWLGDDQLLIADTNHHRIVVVQDLGGGSTRLIGKLAADSEFSRDGHTWPTAVKRDAAGSTWVINSDGFLHDGDLIVYDVEGKARRRIDLGEDADPIVLAALPKAMLVADYQNYRLQRVSLDGLRVDAFGDAAVAGILHSLQTRRDHWQQMRNFSIGMMVLFGLLGASAGYLDWRARRARVAGTRQPGVVRHPVDAARPAALTAAAQMQLRPDAQGIVWLTVAPKFLRTMNLFFLLMGAMLGVVLLLLASSSESQPWRLYAMLGAMSVTIMGALFWAQRRMRAMRIGTDGKELHVVDILGRSGHAPPEEFIHTGRRLLLGRLAVSLPNPHMPVFDKDVFAAVIEPMLERTPRSNEMMVLWQGLRRGDPMTWLGVVAVVIVIVLRVWYEF